MELNKEGTIGVIGAGTMGSGIAQVAAAAGHRVKVYDTNPAAIEKGNSGLRLAITKLVEKKKIAAEKGESILNNVEWTNSLKQFSDCVLVIEAIIEDIDVKQKLFSDLEKMVAPACVLATNTSSLSITSIASACKFQERVIGIHFFNPAPVMPLVEIICGIATDKQLEKEVKELIDGWGKSTVLARDTPGFIVNRVARPYYGESIRIYEEGIADTVTIDWALKEIGGFKMGPFELMDLIGNDINYKVTETVWTQLFFDDRYKPSLTQKRLYEAKRFGRKSGIGYYDYSAEAKIPEPNRDKILGQQICERVVAMLINEAVDALYLRIASAEDLDLAMTKGVNYPKGLLKWCDETGAENILERLNYLREEYNEDRYRPSVLLKKMVREKKKFYA